MQILVGSVGNLYRTIDGYDMQVAVVIAECYCVKLSQRTEYNTYFSTVALLAAAGF